MKFRGRALRAATWQDLRPSGTVAARLPAVLQRCRRVAPLLQGSRNVSNGNRAMHLTHGKEEPTPNPSKEGNWEEPTPNPVSYTHLTLPTIYSV